MARLNWRPFLASFEGIYADIISGALVDTDKISARIRTVMGDPSDLPSCLGADPFLVVYLEFLFYTAEGPLSPRFASTSGVIRNLLGASEPLRWLIDLNAADAIGNMVLNKRGRLKFLIADQLELLLLLDWWAGAGLKPVSQRQVYEAIMQKSTIALRLQAGDPGLILRLLEVFPDYQYEFCPEHLTRGDLIARQHDIRPLPSHRRYHRLYEQLMQAGRDPDDLIREEEMRILPVQTRRNTFLAYLVKQSFHETCQVCASLGEERHGSDISVHHIIPLSAGGEDKADNMLVVCNHHHQAIHAGEMEVISFPRLEFRYTPKKGQY